MSTPSARIDPQQLSNLAAEASSTGAAAGDYPESYVTYLKCLASARLDRSLRVYASVSDIVQDTILSAFKQMSDPGREPVRNLKPWLSRILSIKILELRRKYGKAGRRPESLDGNEMLGTGVADFRKANDAAGMVDGDDAFAWAMASLPRDQRRVVELYLLHGFEMREVAQLVGEKETCVRKRYDRAIAFLRTRIDSAG